MAATAVINIEVDDAGAVAAFQQINAAGAKIAPGLQPVVPQMEKITASTKQGREAAALLSEEFGVRMPRALRNVLAESSVLGPALNAAFTGLAVVGFIDLVKNAVDGLTGFSAALDAIKKQNDELMQSVASANKTLIGPQNLAQVRTQIAAAEKSIAELNKQLGFTGDVFGDALTRGLMKYSGAQTEMLEGLDQAKKTLNDLYDRQAKLVDEQRRTEPVEVLKLQNAARLEGLEGIAKIVEAEKGETAVVREEMGKNIITSRVGMAEINEIHAKAIAERYKLDRDVTVQDFQMILDMQAGEARGMEQIRKELNAKLHQISQEEIRDGESRVDLRLALERDADRRIAELRRQNAEDVRRAEEQAAVDMLPPWQRGYAQISMDTQRRLREIQEALRETRITSEDAARLSAAAWQEEFAKTRDKLAGDLESAFDEITSGGIGKYFLKQFKHLVFQMVASWILGMNQMRSASQQTMNGGGGILGAIFGSLGLGGIFGGGGGGGGQGGISSIPGVITNFGGDGDFGGETNGGGLIPSPFAGGGIIPLSAGFGGGAGTIMPTGSGPGGAAGGIGGLLGKLFSHGAGPISGTGLAALGIGLLASNFMGGGILHALGGAAGGALTGFAIGGPIGALIGGIAGFISGLFSHSTKKARLAIEADVKAQSQKIEDAYDLYQTDWSSARDALEQVRAQGVDALRKAGVKDIKRSRVGHVDQWVDKAEKEIDAVQKERLIRGGLVFGPAQFRFGGFVGGELAGPAPAGFAGAMHFAMGGAVPAIVHAGEFVMREEAVRHIGRSNLERANAGGEWGGDPGIHFHIDAIDKESFRTWLSKGGAAEIMRAIRAGHKEGAW